MVRVSNGCARFRFYRPQAGYVCLAGDFNGWQLGELHMKRGPLGWWTGTLCLPPGTYRFRYEADGEWFTDYASYGIEYGPFGPDGVVRVAAVP